ncbi:MAG: chemotaxis protein CheX [Thermodesulfobacteriota bacterium]
MDTKLRQIIYETLSEVFETMYFTFLEPLFETPAQEELAAADGYYEASITFQGGKSGCLRFYLPQSLARGITVNFLGVDEVDVNEAQILDTVKETANMAVGSLLGRIDPDGTMKLGLPQSRVASAFSSADLLAKPGLFLFNTEHGLLWVVYEEGA